MPRYKILVSKEIEYIVEAENRDDAYEVLHNRGEYLEKKYTHEETLSIELDDSSSVRDVPRTIPTSEDAEKIVVDNKTTPAKFKEGDEVTWIDPDEGFGTGLYLVTKVINENGINSHYMLSNGSSEIEAYEHEMREEGKNDA